MSRRAGVSLLEVLVSSAVLSLIVVVLFSSAVPLTSASSDQSAAVDMDRDAVRILGRLRADLRLSGYEADGTPRVRTTTLLAPDDALELYVRKAPDGAPAPWSPPGALWAEPIRYATEPSNGRLRLVRSEGGGVTAALAEGITSLRFTLPANASSVTVALTLARKGRGTEPDIVRRYSDQVLMLNRRR